jgi:hypothetical protein
MLRLTWVEFFLRSIPEMFILIWGIHVISRKSINILKYILLSILAAIITFFVRWLPIYFGVHIIINIILTISIMVIIKIPLIKAIYSTFLIYFILSLGEFLNMIILSLLNINTSIEFLNPFIKCIYCLPSLIFLSLFIIIINYLLKMKEGIKNVSN